jgi:hypothetical protein
LREKFFARGAPAQKKILLRQKGRCASGLIRASMTTGWHSRAQFVLGLDSLRALDTFSE